MQIPTILVIDDEPNNFEVIEAFLLTEGYQLSYVPSGIKALKRLDSIQPDVILLDVMMPDRDGISVCEEIRQNPNWQHIPILMVTALKSKADLAKCLEAGANDFISKPVNSLELKARVGSLLRIKQQYDALANTLKLREDMANMIIHDLRNPLSGIIFTTELLKRIDIPEKHQKKIERLVSSGNKLQNLVDDLLVMAKLESGNLILNRSSVDLGEIATQTISDFAEIADSKNIQLFVDLPTATKTISLDGNLCRRLLDNLLSNAIKFSPESSKINIKIDYPNDGKTEARIKVIDEGKGVSEAMRETIFKKYEVGNVMSGVKQTGLGLAFCKMVVEAHDGNIFVENNQPQGSIFVVEF